jgi:hypothetical protein
MIKNVFSKWITTVLAALFLVAILCTAYRFATAVSAEELINSSDLIVEGNAAGGGPSNLNIIVTQLYKGQWPDNPEAKIHVHTPYIGLNGGEDLHGLFFLKKLGHAEYEISHGTLGWYITAYHQSEACQTAGRYSISTVAGFNAISGALVKGRRLLTATSGNLGVVNKQIRSGTMCTDTYGTMQPVLTQLGISAAVAAPVFPGLSVISPNSGEMFRTGTGVEVKWNNTTGKDVLVTFIKEDEYRTGHEVGVITNNMLPVNASTTSTTLSTHTPGTYRVMIKAKDDYRYKAVAEHTFTITDATLTIQSPGASNHITFSRNDSWGIQWTTPPSVSEVSVSLCPWGVPPTSNTCISLGKHPALNSTGFWAGDTGNRNGVKLQFPPSLALGDYFILIYSGDTVQGKQGIDYDIGARITIQ